MVDFENALVQILKVSDPFVIQDALNNEIVGTRDYSKISRGLEDQIKYNFPSIIRVNLLNFKYRCLAYLKKLYTIYEINFTPYVTSLQDCKPEKKLDPFKTYYLAYFKTQDEDLKQTILEEIDYFENRNFYNMQNSEYLQFIDREIRMSAEQHDYGDNMGSVNNMQAEEDLQNLNADDNISMDNEDPNQPEVSDFSAGTSHSDDDNMSVLDDNAVSDKDNSMDIIHDWLFSEDVPHFSKSDYIKNIIVDSTRLKV